MYVNVQGTVGICSYLPEELKKTYLNEHEIVLKGTFFLFFHRSNQPSDILKSLYPNFFFNVEGFHFEHRG